MKPSNSFFVGLLFLGVVSFTSCTNTAKNSTDEVELEDDVTELEETINDPITMEPTTVEISTYSEFPDEIDGCACYFARSKSELKKGSYIFTSNYEKRAFMMLDGKMRTFDLKSSNGESGSKLIESWSNKDYELTVISYQTGQIDETWQSAGSFTLTPNGKPSTIITVVGECGC